MVSTAMKRTFPQGILKYEGGDGLSMKMEDRFSDDGTKLNGKAWVLRDASGHKVAEHYSRVVLAEQNNLQLEAE